MNVICKLKLLSQISHLPITKTPTYRSNSTTHSHQGRTSAISAPIHRPLIQPTISRKSMLFITLSAGYPIPPSPKHSLRNKRALAQILPDKLGMRNYWCLQVDRVESCICTHNRCRLARRYWRRARSKYLCVGVWSFNTLTTDGRHLVTFRHVWESRNSLPLRDLHGLPLSPQWTNRQSTWMSSQLFIFYNPPVYLGRLITHHFSY